MKILKWIGALVVVCVLIIVGGIVYLTFRYPDAGSVPDVKIEATQARLERGEYVAKHVAVCIDCHSTRDWNYYAGPIVPGSEGKGGEIFDENLGFPGKITAKNITPSALGNWSDGDVLHAIVAGVNKKNQALFPIMPYPNFAQMTEEDLYSVIAYIRTLKPVDSSVPETSLNFPMNLIVRLIPKKTEIRKTPVDTANTIEYGKYLMTIASCSECHTPQDHGKPLPGKILAGGMEFILPWGTIRSANITPDVETGIGSWTKEQFVNKFKTFAGEQAQQIPMKPPFNESNFNTLMPWLMYSGMSERDLGAIYEYLRTVEPVKNKIVKYSSEGVVINAQ
ncbi:cytochrome c [bacterium]|nr:cytochrome c [bacterium]